jgi:hypothetical protein
LTDAPQLARGVRDDADQLAEQRRVTERDGLTELIADARLGVLPNLIGRLS